MNNIFHEKSFCKRMQLFSFAMKILVISSLGKYQIGYKEICVEDGKKAGSGYES